MNTEKMRAELDSNILGKDGQRRSASAALRSRAVGLREKAARLDALADATQDLEPEGDADLALWYLVLNDKFRGGQI